MGNVRRALLMVLASSGGACVGFDYESDRFVCASDDDCSDGYVCAAHTVVDNRPATYCVVAAEARMAVAFTIQQSAFGCDITQDAYAVEVVAGMRSRSDGEQVFTACDTPPGAFNCEDENADDQCCIIATNKGGGGAVVCQAPLSEAAAELYMWVEYKSKATGDRLALMFGGGPIPDDGPPLVSVAATGGLWDRDVASCTQPLTFSSGQPAPQCTQRATARAAHCGTTASCSGCSVSGDCPSGFFCTTTGQCWPPDLIAPTGGCEVANQQVCQSGVCDPNTSACR